MREAIGQSQRDSRMTSLVRYHKAVNRYIENYHGMIGYDKWSTSLTVRGGLLVTFTHENIVLTMELVTPETSILDKTPLHWEMTLSYDGEFIADQEYEITLIGANELWKRLQNLGKRVRWLHRRGRIYIKHHPDIDANRRQQIIEALEYTEYQNARLLATGIFALYTDIEDIARTRL